MNITLVDSACPDLAPYLIGYLGGEIVEEGLQRRVIPARPNCFIQIILEGPQVHLRRVLAQVVQRRTVPRRQGLAV